MLISCVKVYSESSLLFKNVQFTVAVDSRLLLRWGDSMSGFFSISKKDYGNVNARPWERANLGSTPGNA